MEVGPRVFNRSKDRIPPGAVYVGRPTLWGNPFTIGKDGDRREVIEKYARYLRESGLIDRVSELNGVDLVCWCAPKPCHADVLLNLANGDQREK